MKLGLTLTHLLTHLGSRANRHTPSHFWIQGVMCIWRPKWARRLRLRRIAMQSAIQITRCDVVVVVVVFQTVLMRKHATLDWQHRFVFTANHVVARQPTCTWKMDWMKYTKREKGGLGYRAANSTAQSGARCSFTIKRKCTSIRFQCSRAFDPDRHHP